MQRGQRVDTERRQREVVLVVKTGQVARQQLKSQLRGPQREVYVAGTAAEGMSALQHIEPDVVVLALDLPDLPGLRAVDIFRDRLDDVPIIAMTETPSVGQAVEAMRHGAVDVVSFDDARERLDGSVDRALAEVRHRRQLDLVQQDVKDRYGFSHLMSQSPRMLKVFDQIRSVAGTDATVLIRGETGTGKELVSRAIAERSKRKDKPFIAVNCGAFTESLLESELFGHEKGSFTGAVGRREGLFEMADGGTLFLDELGETSLNVQVNLLRVLEEMRFRRVGGREPVRVDVRIVAATNVELEQAVKEKRFREDLYYRLNVYPIFLPPLRQRREDIPLLMRHFLDEIGEEYELEPPVVAADALESILTYDWPGNVRQLRAMCERWVITRAGQRLEREHLTPDMTGQNFRPDLGGIYVDDQVTMKENTARMLGQVERSYLYQVLQRCGGHLGQTADAAGITRRTLYTKMKQYGLDAGDFRDD
ncbi:MAG: sigma-54-dependent Fis family transcriptional regulator [Deltaproteobacteria bacterium]|nr:MAG: sigma-54-dependent Fis family transcriptional regulator [Deltaproteobacteria bacterium]